MHMTLKTNNFTLEKKSSTYLKNVVNYIWYFHIESTSDSKNLLIDTILLANEKIFSVPIQ